MKIFIHRTLGILIFIAIYFISSEAMLYFFYNKEPASKIITQHDPEFLSDWVYDEDQCPRVQALITHPTLGFVHRRYKQLNIRCKKKPYDANNIGMNAVADLPIKKNKKEFRVMILGGSVAHHFSTYNTNIFIGNRQISFFENYLNENYISPNNHPFVVSTGAVGAWAFPNQITMTMMYAERIDAILSLDGFNETAKVQQGSRLEHVWGGHTIFASFDRENIFHDYLYYHRKFLNFISKSYLKHSYNMASMYQIGTFLINSFFVTDKRLQELGEGASEKIFLPKPEAINWSYVSFEKSIKQLHTMAELNNLYSAQFLQPSKYLGKTLTEKEKSLNKLDILEIKALKRTQQLYLKLQDEKLPIRDLTYVFQNEASSIYSDFVHMEESNKYSRGNELLAHAIGKSLQSLWSLKLKKQH